MLRRDYIVLTKILEEISLSLRFMGNTTIENFLSDELLKHAIGMAVINVGELVKNLSNDLRMHYKNIPWKQIAGFRDITAHKYETLDMEMVYYTVVDDFPTLKSNIELILEEKGVITSDNDNLKR